MKHFKLIYFGGTFSYYEIGNSKLKRKLQIEGLLETLDLKFRLKKRERFQKLSRFLSASGFEGLRILRDLNLDNFVHRLAIPIA